MSNELYIAYWSGEEPTGPGKSPTLDMTPDFIDVVVLFYVVVQPNNVLDYARLTLYNDRQTIKGWMQRIRQRQQGLPKKTKFTLGLLGGKDFASQDPVSFAQTVKAAYQDWGVDGITVDYEPVDSDDDVKKMIIISQEIRKAIGNAVMTAPVYANWKYLDDPTLLNRYARPFNYIETMDYSPYTGISDTLNNVKWYATTIGTAQDPAYNKIAIGVSCMEPPTRYFTPLNDVVHFCKWEPPSGNKLGIMLYTTSYDVTSHGSGYPDGTFTKTIHDNLP